MWNGLENVKPWLLENATEFNHYIQSFNVNTNGWVAQYIYKRLKFLGNRHISQASVLLFLAVWHGFHSGYYVCFVFEFLVIYLEKDVRHLFHAVFMFEYQNDRQQFFSIAYNFNPRQQRVAPINSVSE